MEDTVASRLKLFIDTSGLTSTQFADMCGIPRPSLSQILSGRNKKISDILVGQIHRAFPDLSVVWLLFGEGPVKTGNTRTLSTNPSAGDSSEAVSDQDSNRISGSDSRGSLTSTHDSGRNTGFSSNFSNLNPANPSSGNGTNENSNLRGFNSSETPLNPAENQVFESDLKILDLTQQIEQMKKNPRKVLQITIYYDDSTFETFIPK